jgi:hypothetical protein
MRQTHFAFNKNLEAHLDEEKIKMEIKWIRFCLLKKFN